MKNLSYMFRKRAENGSVAVEMAIILPIFLLLLTSLLFFARVFWYYSVAQKAAHDAARFLSTAPQADMRTIGTGANEPASAAVARWIVNTEVEVMRPVMNPLRIYVQCGIPATTGAYINYEDCGDGVPQTVRVFVTMRMRDNMFPDFTWDYFGEDGLRMTADVTMRYAGN